MDDQIFKNLQLQNSVFENFENSRNFFYKIRKIFVCFCFIMYTKRKCSQLKKKIGVKRPKRLVYNKTIIFFFLNWLLSIVITLQQRLEVFLCGSIVNWAMPLFYINYKNSPFKSHNYTLSKQTVLFYTRGPGPMQSHRSNAL